MKELSIQAEVGRRLRAAIGRTHSNHALRINVGDDRDELVDELVELGKFSARDADALRRMHIDTIRALHKKFVGDDEAEAIAEVANTRHDEAVTYMATMGKTGNALERQNQRRELGARADRVMKPRYFQVSNGIHDEIAIGMVPPDITSPQGSLTW